MQNLERKNPELTGLDRVLQENLYGNWRFPQRGVTIFAYTLDALLADKDPKKLIIEYLETPISEERTKRLFDEAVKAHLAFLPKDKQPVLDLPKMKELWEEEQRSVATLLYYLFIAGPDEELNFEITDAQAAEALAALRENELPVEEIRRFARAIKETAADKEVAAKLTEYRKSYKEKGEWGDNSIPDTLAEELVTMIGARSLARLLEEKGGDQEMVRKLARFLAQASGISDPTNA